MKHDVKPAPSGPLGEPKEFTDAQREARGDWPLVVKNDDGIRPAGKRDTCMYCSRKVGEKHKGSCVTVRRTVRLRYTFEIDVRHPYAWTGQKIEDYINDGTWCANNALYQLQEAADALGASDCLCGALTVKYLGSVDSIPHRLTQPGEPEPPKLHKAER